MPKAPRFVVTLICVIALGGLAVGGCFLLLLPAAGILGRATDAQARAIPALAPLPQRSVIRDRNGGVIQQIFANQDRELVKLAEVPQSVIDAVLATEDRDFFSHSGVDLKGILRAFKADVHAGAKRQGGSTITQQLVKNNPAFFKHGRGNGAKNKFKEAVYAYRLEQSYSKQEILQAYLNTVYFGHSAYGVKAAAERYFNKPVRKLSMADAALLAGLIKAPSDDEPIGHPAAARQRRNEVLQAMEETGAITPVEAARYSVAPLPKRVYNTAPFAPQSYFVDAMMRWLVNGDNDAARALGSTREQRQRLLDQGGLQITTTWDPALQQDADTAIADHNIVRDNTGPHKGRIQAAMVVLDNYTGAVRAMVGGPDYATQKLNFATMHGIQPGSSFKVFTLAAALEAGYSPSDSIDGSKGCSFSRPLATQDNYSPGSESGYGIIGLRTAIADSINCAFVRLEISLGHGEAGPKRVIEIAHRLGVSNSSALYPGTGITLGDSPVTALDMATAYATIASDGVRHDPTYVTQITTSDGNVIYNASGSAPHPVLSPQVARTLTDMLKGVIRFGTASGNAEIHRPAAGKTGTTDLSEALWFTGYTPQLTVSVSVGNPACEDVTNRECSLENVFGGRGQAFGGHVAAPIWRDFMNLALAGVPPLDFVAPDPNLWPDPGRITENGRNVYTQPLASDTTTTTFP